MRGERPGTRAMTKPRQNQTTARSASTGRRPFAALRRHVERWGVLRAAYIQLMSSLASHLGLSVCIVNLRALHSVDELPPLPEGYSARELTEADYRAACRDPALEMSEAFVTQARQNHGFCVGAFHESALVSYLWRGFKEVAISDSLMLEIPPSTRYGYKALTLPAHRGQHLQHTLALLSDRKCLEMGYTQSASYIETHNFASRRSDARRGNQTIGYLAWMVCGSLRWRYSSPGIKRHGIRLRWRRNPQTIGG